VQELEQLMSRHGGKFANYYYKNVVTHVVCDQLPDTKLKQLLKSKSATPVVRAAWITESIAAGKLLPISYFAIDRLAGSAAQQRMCVPLTAPKHSLHQQDIYPQLDPQHCLLPVHEHQGDGPATDLTQPRSSTAHAAVSPLDPAAHGPLSGQKTRHLPAATLTTVSAQPLNSAGDPFTAACEGQNNDRLGPGEAADSSLHGIAKIHPVLPYLANEQLETSAMLHDASSVVPEIDGAVVGDCVSGSVAGPASTRVIAASGDRATEPSTAQIGLLGVCQNATIGKPNAAMVGVAAADKDGKISTGVAVGKGFTAAERETATNQPQVSRFPILDTIDRTVMRILTMLQAAHRHGCTGRVWIQGSESLHLLHQFC
jgi:hypothetical protein